MDATTAAAPGTLNYVSTVVPDDRVRIGFPMRIVAAVIDAVIAYVVGTIVFAIVYFVIGGFINAWLGRALGMLLFVVIQLAYFGTEVFKAQSPAKMIFKFFITLQDGSPAPQPVLMKRYAYWIVTLRN